MQTHPRRNVRGAVTALGVLLLAGCRPGEHGPSVSPPPSPAAADVVAATDQPALPGAASLADLAWLAGTWRAEQGDTVIEEMWSAPGGGTMLAINRTIQGTDTVAFEWLRIEARPQGIVYVAHPGGRMPGTEFMATQVEEDGSAVFENPKHDFPQRIAYRLESPDRLVIDVTGQGSPLHFELDTVR